MSIQTYNTVKGRLGKLAGEIIGHAMQTEVLSTACKNYDMPKNKSDTIVFRSWVPWGATVASPNRWDGRDGTTQVTAAQHILNEGVTPPADTIQARDVSMTLKQYGALYQLTDKDYNVYEDEIDTAMKEQVGERIGLVREQTLYEGMRQSTNVFYAGGTSLVTTDEKISEKLLAKAVRSLKQNHGKMVTKVLNPSVNVGTSSVEASYVAFVHTDAEYDLRQLPNFTVVADYGQRKTISDYELGTWQNIRFVTSPDLQPIVGASGLAIAVGVTGLYASGGSYVDVYPMIIVAQDAFAQVKVRGLGDIDPTFIAPGQKDKNDPLGQRGYIGATFWDTTGILNPGWLTVVYTGVSDLA